MASCQAEQCRHSTSRCSRRQRCQAAAHLTEMGTIGTEAHPGAPWQDLVTRLSPCSCQPLVPGGQAEWATSCPQSPVPGAHARAGPDPQSRLLACCLLTFFPPLKFKKVWVNYNIKFFIAPC